MSQRIQIERQRITLFLNVASLLTALLGLLGIAGWIFDIPLLASFGLDKIPMALSTAFLFFGYGLIFFFHNNFSSNRLVHYVGIAFSSFGILISTLLFYLSLNKIHLAVEHLWIKLSGGVEGLAVGYMSPITAVMFGFIGFSFILILLKTTGKRQIRVSLIIAILVIAGSFILLLSYLFGTPLFYEGNFIPPALPTSLAFLFLGITLLLMAGFEILSYHELSHAINTRSTSILSVVFIILTIGIVTAGYSYYRVYEKHYRSEIENQLSSIAQLKVSHIVQWRKERLGDASIFLKNINFSELVIRLFENPNDAKAKLQIKDWLVPIINANQLNEFCIHDDKGIERFVMPDTTRIHSSSYNKFIANVMKSGKIIFEDFYKDDVDNKVYLNIFIPIFSSVNSKQITGFISIRIDPEQYLYPLINEWPIPSKTSEAFIVRREGNNTLFLSNLRIQKNTALNLRVPLTETKMPAVQAALGKTQLMEGVDPRGVSFIAYVSAIPNSPWSLVARMDFSEVNIPLQERFWLMAVFAFVLITGTGSTIGLVWRHQRLQFYKEKLIVEKERASLQQIISKSINEIYVFDAETLKFIYVNDGAIKNLGYSKEELLNMTPLHIKPRFSNNPFKEMIAPLYDRKIPVLYFETVHQRKDGSEYDAEVHLQLIDSEKGLVFLAVIYDITERKKTLNTLNEVEQNYKTLANSGQTLIWTAGTDKLCNYFNNVWLEFTGRTFEEEFGDGWVEGVHPDDKERCLNIYVQAFDRREKFYLEYRLRRYDGVYRWILDDGCPRYNSKGEFTGYIGHCLDITERKQEQEALNTSEERFRTIFNDAPLGIALINSLTGHIYEVNPMFAKIAGRTMDQMANIDWMSITHPDDIQEDQDNMALLNAGKIPGFNMEKRYLHFDGTTVWINMTIAPLAVKDLTKPLHLCMIEDITERKHAEVEILMLAQSLKSVNECVSITDTEDIIQFVNESFLKTYGYDEKELIGKHISIVRTLSNTPEFVKEILPSTIDGGWQGELWNKRKDGSEFPIYLSTSIVKDNNGKQLGLIGVATDITERKRIEKELIDAKEKAEQAHKLKSEFLNQMSHEIRSPMNTVLSFTNLLKEEVIEKVTPDYLEYFDGIDTAGHRLIRTVDLIMNVSEMQVGTYEPFMSEFDLLEEIIHKILNENMKSIEEKNLKLNFFSTVPVAMVFGDQYSIYQIFANLVDNAIKYTKNGSISIYVSKDESGLSVCIEDTGIGMSEEFKKMMYQPFTQEEQGYSRRYDGNGLGLSLVKTYCDLNKITITLESKKGVGTKFTLLFTRTK